MTGVTYGSSLTATYGFDTYGYPTSTTTGSIQDYRYVFDATTGNLTSRQNFKRSLSESFGYDNLDRLIAINGPQNLTMTYNANGNILTKSDISSATAFTYGASAGPYALTGVTSSTNVIPSVAQTITYTSFESVATIGENNYAASIIYNSDNQRAKMDVTQSGTNILTRWYAGSSYTKETASGVTKEYTYLGGDAYHAPVVAVTQGGTTTYYYLLRDYLGNITHVYNSSTSTAQEYSFDAWGRRRNPTNWGYDLTSQPELFADRGFTSHEYLKYFNLYNMNGRMYDPLVGRFISPDPFVQMPGSTQSMNRYTYCMNNPLIYVDYNGYTWFTKLGDWMGKSGQTIAMIGVTIAVSAVVVASCGTAAPLLVAIAAGAASGAVGGALGAAFQGGNVWHGVLSGAASGAVSGLIGGTLGKWAVKGLQNWGINGLTKFANSPVIKSALASGLAGTVAGGITGFGTELAMGGNFNDAINAGVNGAIVGGTIGALAGGRAGYKQAKAMGIDPWTGKPQQQNTNNSISQKDLTFSGKQKNHNQNSNLEGKSYLTMDEQTLLDDLNSGNYDVIGLEPRNSHPIVRFNYESIGTVVGRSGSVIGNTNIATIHLNSQGQIHIVPRY